MTKKELEKYLANPNVQKMLALIRHTEGTEKYGARTAFGGGRIKGSLSDHPRQLHTFTQKNGKKNKTSAAGAYQFLQKTWDNVSKQYGLNDFGSHNQDLAAVALLAGRGALDPLLKGDFETAVRRSGKEWASLPSAPASYSQPTKSWKTVNDFLGGKIKPKTMEDGASNEYEMDTLQAEEEPLVEPFVPYTPTMPTTTAESLLPPTQATAVNPIDAMLGIAKEKAYTKPGEKIPLVSSFDGLAYPENEDEFDLFSSVKQANLAPEEEPAVVAVGEALTRAKQKQASQPLIDTNPLIPIIGDLFDTAEV